MGHILRTISACPAHKAESFCLFPVQSLDAVKKEAAGIDPRVILDAITEKDKANARGIPKVRFIVSYCVRLCSSASLPWLYVLLSY